MVVVGSGPSLEGKGLGSWLDNYGDDVMKFNGDGNRANKDYGYRADYIVFTPGRTKQLHQFDLKGVKTMFLYTKREPKKFIRSTRKAGYDGPIVVANNYVAPWVAYYKKHYLGQYSQPLCAVPSKGTVGLLMAITQLKYKTILVAGFDCVLLGDTSFILKDSEVGPRHHNYPLEGAMIRKAALKHGVKLLTLQTVQ